VAARVVLRRRRGRRLRARVRLAPNDNGRETRVPLVRGVVVWPGGRVRARGRVLVRTGRWRWRCLVHWVRVVADTATAITRVAHLTAGIARIAKVTTGVTSGVTGIAPGVASRVASRVAAGITVPRHIAHRPLPLPRHIALTRIAHHPLTLAFAFAVAPHSPTVGQYRCVALSRARRLLVVVGLTGVPANRSLAVVRAQRARRDRERGEAVIAAVITVIPAEAGRRAGCWR
jgi:hypothetical protein